MGTNHPLILVPGFTGTQLQTLCGIDPSYRTWINVQAIQRGESPGPGTANYQAGRWWTSQMILAADGMTPVTDPLYNKPVPGLDGISILDPGGSTGNTRYFYSLIQRLRSIGYTEDNLLAASYDWRLPPVGLERHYAYFSMLKATIGRLVADYQLRVVLLGHSLGNRVIQYFLQWIIVADPLGGRQWIDDHIGRFIAVSALWLGVPKSVHEGIADLGHLGIMNITGVKPLYQSYGALPWMLPMSADHFAYLNTTSFAFLNNDDNPLTIRQAWEMAGARSLLRYENAYYHLDPHITSPGSETGNRCNECPYIGSLDVLYATGQDTEIGAYYTPAPGDRLVVNTQATTTNPNFKVVQGVRYESQGLTRQYTDGSLNSGDGFLPYGSLMYYTRWQKQFPKRVITGQSFPGNTHYDILENETFVQTVCTLVSQRE